MESDQTDPLEIFHFAQEMEQIEDHKRHKKPASLVKTPPRFLISQELLDNPTFRDQVKRAAKDCIMEDLLVSK